MAYEVIKQKEGKTQTRYAVLTDDLATPHRPRHLYPTESPHPPGYHVTVAVLRTAIKEVRHIS